MELGHHLAQMRVRTETRVVVVTAREKIRDALPVL